MKLAHPQYPRHVSHRIYANLRIQSGDDWGGGSCPICVYQKRAPTTGKARDLFILALFTCTSAVNKIID